jgi:hypothetical protein
MKNRLLLITQAISDYTKQLDEQRQLQVLQVPHMYPPIDTSLSP